MDSDTLITLDHTEDAIKLSQNYMQRQGNDEEKRVAFSSASDESNDDYERREGTSGHAQGEGEPASNITRVQFRHLLKRAKGRRQQAHARKNEKECNYCKKAGNGKWFQGHEESECHHKKKDEAEAAFQAIKEGRERTGKGRQATQSEKKAFAAGAVVHKGQRRWDQPQLGGW